MPPERQTSPCPSGGRSTHWGATSGLSWSPRGMHQEGTQLVGEEHARGGGDKGLWHPPGPGRPPCWGLGGPFSIFSSRKAWLAAVSSPPVGRRAGQNTWAGVWEMGEGDGRGKRGAGRWETKEGEGRWAMGDERRGREKPWGRGSQCQLQQHPQAPCAPATLHRPRPAQTLTQGTLGPWERSPGV